MKIKAATNRQENGFIMKGMHMKNFLGILAAVAVAGFSGDALAKGANSESAPPPPPVHHASSAPVAAPVVSGVPHNAAGGVPRNLTGTGSYRPVTVPGNGQQTLVYPGVRNSMVRHPANLKLNAIHNSASQGNGKVRSQPPSGLVTKTKLDPQKSAQLRNWTGNRSTTAQAKQINANNHHHHHDHDWWKHHCVTFIFFDDGWWGWDDGWWYPAWGYDAYSNYEYNQPIYGDVSPDQIVAGVQAELQRRGYYMYAIDGKMGPLTRAALARYQTDHRMNITSGIDPATLNSLGVIR
ncbi:MAG TPA: peptidoglycan-binding protein [Chthoniobacterales bacterium]|nr:peptidoglycan-binding protein [Chthoniobacterales bacterium]